MIISDYHIHSHYSFDSSEAMQNIAQKAIDQGLKEIALTDHFETLDPNMNLNQIIDYKRYYQDVEELREKFAGKLTIRLGSEINLEKPMKSQMEDAINRYPFDFIIGSLHAVDFVDVGMSEYYGNLSVDEYHRRYFEDLLDAVKDGFTFSVLGHLDFVTRYGGYRNNIVDVRKQYDLLREILTNVIDLGRGIELNTSAMRYRLDDFHPSVNILRLYKELGGEIITIGSDSHTARTIAQDFELAEEVLLQLGYKYYATFERMKPILNRLG